MVSGHEIHHKKSGDSFLFVQVWFENSKMTPVFRPEELNNQVFAQIALFG